MKCICPVLLLLAAGGALAPAQEAQPPAEDAKPVLQPVNPVVAPYMVGPGTKILLSMINSVSTKTAAEGDRIYLETSFPILSNGKS